MRDRISIAVASFMLVLAFAAPAPAAAPKADEARTFLREGLDAAFEVLRGNELTERQKTARLRLLLRAQFDVPTIGKFVLGIHRRQASPAQMKAYLVAFEEFLINVYIYRIVGYAPGQDERIGDVLKVTGTRPAGRSDIFVLTTVARHGLEPEPVEWRIRERNGRLAVIDVNIRGTSQALTYKQEFATVIRRRGNGIDGLIAELKEKNAARRTGSGAANVN